MSIRYRGRFAPSPTGPLHFGSLVAAFGSWLMARSAGGEWLVRIEDLDPPRTVPGAAQAQLRTLAAFGLLSDAPVVHQIDRGALYDQALTQLLENGQAFACHCSRSLMAGIEGVHRHCLSRTQRPRPAIRLRVPDASVISFEDGLQGHVEQDLAAAVGDFVLRRADGYWAYQLAVVVDDAEQGITDVVRGADLLDSTARQIFLQRQLGLATPRYAHLPVIVDDEGRKLSKSMAALPLDGADPLPALHAAWIALGQDARCIGGLQRRDDLLRKAVDSFIPSAIPRVEQPVPAAVQHMDVTPRE